MKPEDINQIPMNLMKEDKFHHQLEKLRKSLKEKKNQKECMKHIQEENMIKEEAIQFEVLSNIEHQLLQNM